ncbi:hypothetical protein [Pseudonocardia sp. TMWB2A]|uniref:hypothetical protein n=1 Tax=Pseudonocardia sp. TMWB2A TaxID=687430 RepID=UPI00307E9AD4
MRSHRDLSMVQHERIAESLLVDCDPPGRLGRFRGCGARAGERCTSLATGAPLEGLGAHVDRLRRAREAPRSSPPSPRPSTEDSPAVSPSTG